MSPKSRGRPPGRGRPEQPSRGRPVRQSYPAGRAIADARRLVEEDSRLIAESAASAWLGDAWRGADIQEHDPESMLILGVAGRVHDKPSLHGYAAVRGDRADD